MVFVSIEPRIESGMSGSDGQWFMPLIPRCQWVSTTKTGEGPMSLSALEHYGGEEKISRFGKIYWIASMRKRKKGKMHTHGSVFPNLSSTGIQQFETIVQVYVSQTYIERPWPFAKYSTVYDAA